MSQVVANVIQIVSKKDHLHENVFCLYLWLHLNRFDIHNNNLQDYYLFHISLNIYIFTGYFIRIKLICPTDLTKVRVTFTNSEKTWALFGVTLSLTAAPWETILT